MPGSSSSAVVNHTYGLFAPKIYYFHPLLAGSRSKWPNYLIRCRDLGFDHIISAPLFAPGKAGDLFLTADYERVHPAIATSESADQVAAEFAELCRAHGLKLLLDIVVGRVAADAPVVEFKPDWFYAANAAGIVVAPRSSRRPAYATDARFDKSEIANELADWWIARLQRLTQAGIAGFRCGQPHLVPADIWRRIITTVKRDFPACRFLAWTPGLDWQAIAGLRGIGFDAAF